jgi:hypothetical protein
MSARSYLKDSHSAVKHKNNVHTNFIAAPLQPSYATKCDERLCERINASPLLPAMSALDERYYKVAFSRLTTLELSLISTVRALNRAIFYHETAVKGDRTRPPTLALIMRTCSELKALRNLINRHPLTALRMRADLRQVRERWFRALRRDPMFAWR